MSKYFDFPDKLTISLTTASGVEKVTKSEVKRLLGLDVSAINGTLTFNGSMLDVAKCNVNLRTADRVYIKVGEFLATDFNSIFDNTVNLNWENFIPSDAKLLVDGKCVKSKIFATSSCQSVINKAIAVRLCEKYKMNRLPMTGANYQVVFSLFKDTLTLYLNTSGQGLHKRGYRDLVGIAPIKETLASAMLLYSDYYWEKPLADPFCGSGTILIEGARIGLNIAGGISRRFDFNEWKNVEKKFYAQAYEQAKDNEKRDRKLQIFGSDIDAKAIELCNRHLERAGLKDRVSFTVKDAKYFGSSLKNGTIVTNPPYGERVYDRKQAEECYKGLSEAYKKLDNWLLYLITSAPNFEKSFKIRADKKRKLYNSNKECNLYYYYKKKGDSRND